MSFNARCLLPIILILTCINGQSQEMPPKQGNDIPSFSEIVPINDKNLYLVTEFLNEASIPFEKRSLLAEYGGFGSSILVRKILDDSAGMFILAVPLCADYAVKTAMALSQKFPERTNVLIAFLGDEKISLPHDLDGTSHRGLRDLLTLNDISENWVLCYLDIDEAPWKLALNRGQEGNIVPLEIIKNLPVFLNARGIPWFFKSLPNESSSFIKSPSKFFPADTQVPEIAQILTSEEVNGFIITGTAPIRIPGKYSDAPAPLSHEVLAALILDYADSISLPVHMEDRHYTVLSFPFPGFLQRIMPKNGNVTTFPFGRKVFYLSEGMTTALFLLTTGLLILFFLILSIRNNARIYFQVRLFLKTAWIFIILIPLLVFSFKVAGLLYSLLFSVLYAPNGYPSGYLNSAGLISAGYTSAGSFFTMLFSVLLFLIPFFLLDIFFVPRKDLFYKISSVLYISLSLFFSLFFNFSNIPVVLWVFILMFAGALFNNPIPVFICIVLSPLFSIGKLSGNIETGSPGISGFSIAPFLNLSENLSAIIQLSLFILSIFMMILRVINLTAKNPGRITVPGRRHRRFLLIPLLMTLAAGSMIISILLILGQQTSPERRHITEDNSKNPEEILSISNQDIYFQDIRIITLKIEAKGKPVRFDVSLNSDNGENLLPVYSSPVPFERDEDGKKIIFILGEYAPNPLNMEIVIPVEFHGLLDADALYNFYDPLIDNGEKPASDDYIMKVSKRISL